MAQARHSKHPPKGSRKLSLDEIEDLWIVVEDAADSDDPRVLREAIAALQTLISDNPATARASQ